MHARLSCLLLLVVVASPLHAQDDKLIAVVKAQVKKMIDATAEGKYQVVLDLTHPKVLEELGGKDKAGQIIKKVMDAIKAQGFTFKILEINQPTVVKGKGGYFTVAPYTMMISGMGKKITSKTAVVGVSNDEGRTWTFVNIDAEGEAKVRRLIPDLPRELKVPRQEDKSENN